MEKNLRRSHCSAHIFAEIAQHQAVTVELFVLVLLDNPQVVEIMNHYKIDTATVKAKLVQHLNTAVPRIPSGHSAYVCMVEDLSRIMEVARLNHRTTDRPEVDGASVLREIVSDEGSEAARILAHAGLTNLRVALFLAPPLVNRQ